MSESADGQVYRPWTPGDVPRDVDEPDGGEQQWADPFTRSASELDRKYGPRLRRPPSGMSRRDRREWKMLEAARVHRLRADQLRSAPDESFQPGFITSPPKYLDRRSRKAWLAIERESSTAWWEQRRGATHDIRGRERGALAFALIAAALLGSWVIAGLVHRSATATSGPATAVTVASASMPAAPAPTTTAAAAAAVSGATTGVTPTVGPAGEPGRLGTLDPGWSPTPAGGVPAITTAPTPTPIKAATVHLVAAPTAPITAADTSTPRAAAAAWAARMCPQSYTESFLTARALVKPLMTAAGWATEVGSSAEQGFWKLAAANKQTTRCGQISVTVSPDQPTTGGLAYVIYRGLRVVTAAAGSSGSGSSTGEPPVVTVMSGVRTVLRQPDGRWLVDVTAPAGG